MHIPCYWHAFFKAFCLLLLQLFDVKHCNHTSNVPFRLPMKNRYQYFLVISGNIIDHFGNTEKQGSSSRYSLFKTISPLWPKLVPVKILKYVPCLVFSSIALSWPCDFLHFFLKSPSPWYSWSGNISLLDTWWHWHYPSPFSCKLTHLPRCPKRSPVASHQTCLCRTENLLAVAESISERSNAVHE